MTLEVTAEARSYIAQQGFGPVYGARPLRRFIAREVETRIGRALLAGDVRDGAVIRAGLAEGELARDLRQPGVSPPPHPQDPARPARRRRRQSAARVWRWPMQDNRNHMYSGPYVADRLRRLGFPELADVALRELPDPVHAEQLENWGMRHGLSKDDLISRMGGSP